MMGFDDGIWKMVEEGMLEGARRFCLGVARDRVPPEGL
jgi:hypothetical protein